MKSPADEWVAQRRGSRVWSRGYVRTRLGPHRDSAGPALSLNRRLTLRCKGVERGARGSGIDVDPERVRQARLDAGLSLAQLAGDDVSRTSIHFVERGRSRPSRGVLALIARRTGKPISYFTRQLQPHGQPSADLASELTRLASHVRQFVNVNHLTNAEHEAMKLIEVALRQGAQLTKTVQSNSRTSKRP